MARSKWLGYYEEVIGFKQEVDTGAMLHAHIGAAREEDLAKRHKALIALRDEMPKIAMLIDAFKTCNLTEEEAKELDKALHLAKLLMLEDTAHDTK